MFQNTNLPSKDKDLPREAKSKECATKSKGIEAPNVELKNTFGKNANKRIYSKILTMVS